MRRPISINQPKQLIVEGRDAEEFFTALLNKMDVENVRVGSAALEIQNFGGVNELSSFLRALRVTPGFSQVVSLGIIRDAERDPVSAFQSVCSVLQNAGFNAPKQPGIFEGDRPRISVLILPDAETPGMLESLCLRAIGDDSIMRCVYEYFDCVKQSTQSVEFPKNIEKSMIQAFLASKPEYTPHLGVAAHKGYWPWNNPVFDHIKQFLFNM